MHLFTDLNTRIAALAALLPGEVSVQTLGAAVASLGDEQVGGVDGTFHDVLLRASEFGRRVQVSVGCSRI